MATITFINGANTITVEAPASRSWRMAGTGSPGEATISLPRGSAAASPTYIDPDGGSVVRIASQGGCGSWTGVILPIEEDGRTIELRSVQMWAILSRRHPTRAGTLAHVTAGYVASVILREALAGVAGLGVTNAPFEGGAHIAEFTLDGTDAAGMLSSLMDLSDGELHIDPDSGRIDWCGALAYASRYPTLLIAGGNLHGARYRTDATNRVAEVTATNGTERYTARRGDAAAGGWPAQARVSSDHAGAALVAIATAELHERAGPAVAISGSVGPNDWAIRERNHVRVLVPWGRMTGATHTCRVLGRSLDDGAPLMGVELQVLPELPGTTITPGAGARQRPPQRTSRDRLHGGSFAQQFLALKRERARTEG